RDSPSTDRTLHEHGPAGNGCGKPQHHISFDRISVSAKAAAFRPFRPWQPPSVLQSDARMRARAPSVRWRFGGSFAVDDLTPCFFTSNSITFLHLPDELITLSFNNLPIIVR